MEKLIGVKHSPETSSKNPWKAQINRCGRTYYLGLFATPAEGCRAYDNAAYYLKAWSSNRAATLMNYPEEYEQNIPAPMLATIRVRQILRKLHPEMEKAEASKATLTTTQGLQLSVSDLFDSSKFIQTTLQTRFADCMSRLSLAEARLKQAEADIAQRDRIIEGLRLQGGQQFFKKVGDATVPATSVENHLA